MSKEDNQIEKIVGLASDWFVTKGWSPSQFQLEAWEAYARGYSGLVNAPTGSGKTYSLLLPAILSCKKEEEGMLIVWITPMKALSKEILLASERAIAGLEYPWEVARRTGDTTARDREIQKARPPQILITTPESMHVLMTSKGYSKLFSKIKVVIVDEWHELMGSKRGVQVELLLSRIKAISKAVKIWGISATIGNMEEAIEVLLGSVQKDRVKIIRSKIEKEISIETLLPETIATLPWAGHLGLVMLPKVVEVIEQNNSTLIFTNTRAQCEIWYQRILDQHEELAGQIAMHHGSLSKEIREWVEDNLHQGKLKAVVCTSSLDLGVDFRPVDQIIQIGSPKGIARFVQRAGRSGHAPGMKSKIYFVPTHSLEILESAALKGAVNKGKMENRMPYIRSFDVLAQYMLTLAVGEGFDKDVIFDEITTCFSYKSITKEEYEDLLYFLISGGKSLSAYDEYHKLIYENGLYKVESKGQIQRHKLSIGTITSDLMIKICYINGKKLGEVEEWFVSQLEPGDAFWFAGRSLELIRLKELTAQVRDSKNKNGKIPSYMGGRLSLSSHMSEELKIKLNNFISDEIEEDVELQSLEPLLLLQKERSHLPNYDELLVEYFSSDQGYHLMIYPFEGRNVHEGLASLVAKRISRKIPISFSIAMNDYGFELLSEKKINIELLMSQDIFDEKNLMEDIQESINAVELACRNFRDISKISGLLFTGYPGKAKKARHLQSSSQLLFEVFRDYDPNNLLYLQTYEEVRTFQLEEDRIRRCLRKIATQKIVIRDLEKPSPFCFPLIVDRLREKLSSEKLEDRIKKMVLL